MTFLDRWGIGVIFAYFVSGGFPLMAESLCSRGMLRGRPDEMSIEYAVERKQIDRLVTSVRETRRGGIYAHTKPLVDAGWSAEEQEPVWRAILANDLLWEGADRFKHVRIEHGVSNFLLNKILSELLNEPIRLPETPTREQRQDILRRLDTRSQPGQVMQQQSGKSVNLFYGGAVLVVFSAGLWWWRVGQGWRRS
jgi:hypothetical protein